MVDNNEYTSEYKAITDVQSTPFHNIALLWGSSTDNEWRAAAFQTNLTVRRIERVESVATLSDGETLNFGMLQSDGHEESAGVSTDPSEDRLRISDQTHESMVEWGVSVSPDDVYVGAENPSGVAISGLQGDRRRGFSASSLDEHGVLSQRTRTPDGVPTTALSTTPSQGLVRVDSDDEGRNPIRFGFMNGSGGEVTVDVTAYGALYHVTPITDTATVEEIVFGDGYQRRTLVWGGFENDSPNLPEEWYNSRITLDDTDVPAFL